jgi:hypothetical protein
MTMGVIFPVPPCESVSKVTPPVPRFYVSPTPSKLSPLPLPVSFWKEPPLRPQLFASKKSSENPCVVGLDGITHLRQLSSWLFPPCLGRYIIVFHVLLELDARTGFFCYLFLFTIYFLSKIRTKIRLT